MQSIETSDHSMLRVGDTVELAERHPNRRDGDFLRIKEILHNPITNRVTLSGILMRRCRLSGGLLPSKMNELYIPVDDADYTKNSLPLTDIDYADCVYHINGRPAKRDVVITNQSFPNLSFRDDTFFHPYSPTAEEQKRVIFENEKLICRWLIASKIEELHAELPNRLSVRAVRGQEADQLHAVPDWHLLESWHGAIDDSQDFTFGDCFCGAGGVSVGAARAGLKVKFAFDHNSDACSTYELNNPDTVVWNSDVNHFLSLMEQLQEFKVDILHLSPPCQAYSPANTLAGLRDPTSLGGQHDDANQAASFGISQLIEQCKPRVVTMEQTSGILRSRSTDYLRGIVSQLTSKDYSVSYNLTDLAGYATPHHRRRLILIGSCPGSKLPPLPVPTHGPGTSNNYCTINHYLRGIDETCENHNPVPAGPYNWAAGNTLLKNLISTTGTANRHPSGRPYTVRELAALMTLPLSFRFAPGLPNRILKRQIGNMVPAKFTETLFTSLKKALARENQEIADSKRDAEILNRISGHEHMVID